MVPARNLQLLRDAHATPAFLAAALTAHPHHHMAQEPINQEPPKPPPPREPPQEEEHRQAVLPPPPPPQQHLQPAAGTSSSSSGGRSSNGGGGGGAGDWLRLGLGPASPGPGAAAPEIDLFTAPPRHGHDVRDNMGMPPGASARPAVPGIPQPSMQMPVPRAGPPWMPPWSPASANHPSLLLPFGHRGFYGPGPGSPAASSSDFDTIRVVLPPPAATAAPSVWFVLQAAPHQGKEPFLPQIPRSYLRIKDGRVTVRLLIKYLVNKLRLEDESEVEITCRGRPLLPFMTLQHVRDTIWCERNAVSPSVSADMSTVNHIMVLQYGRRP